MSSTASRGVTPARLITGTLIAGTLLNILGWLGNALLLRSEWQAALATSLVRPRERGIGGELLTLVPDYVYAAAWLAVYALARTRGSPPIRTAIATGLGVWIVGAATTYLGIASAGLLPVRISVLTSVLALVTFVMVAALVPRLVDRGAA